MVVGEGINPGEPPADQLALQPDAFAALHHIDLRSTSAPEASFDRASFASLTIGQGRSSRAAIGAVGALALTSRTTVPSVRASVSPSLTSATVPFCGSESSQAKAEAEERAKERLVAARRDPRVTCRRWNIGSPLHSTMFLFCSAVKMDSSRAGFCTRQSRRPRRPARSCTRIAPRIRLYVRLRQ